MSELATQAERYERLSRKFTSLYHKEEDDQFLVVTDLETKVEDSVTDLPSHVFLKQLHENFGKNAAFLLELLISTVSQDRTLVIRRVNFFGSEEGFYFLKSLPIEKDINNPRETLDDFCRHYAQRFQAIKNQIISRYSTNPNESLEKLQNEFGFQLTEEIVSGGEGLARSAIALPEEIEKEEATQYRPSLLIRIPVDFREDEIPVIPRLLEKTDVIHLLQPGREAIGVEPETLLRAIFKFSSDFLTSVQRRYSINEAKDLVEIYRSFVMGLKEIVERGSGDWPSLLSQIRGLVDKLSAEKQEDATREKETREILEFARRRSTSFLIGRWYSEFIEASMDIIRKVSKRPILDFIVQSGDLGILGPESELGPEEVLDMIVSNFEQLLGLVTKEEHQTALRSIRSSVQSRMLDLNLLDAFAEYCKNKMRIASNTTPITFDPSRNVSEILANLDAFRRSGSWEPREIEKVRQSINLAIDELNILQPRQISAEDFAGLFEYLAYWGVDPPGGSLITSGTLTVSSSEPSWVMSFQLDREIGVVGLVCLESTGEEDEDTSSGLYDYNTLQPVLSRLKNRFKDEKDEVTDLPATEVIE